MKIVYVLKVVEQENLLRNFLKVGTAETKQTFEKSATNWHDGYR